MTSVSAQISVCTTSNLTHVSNHQSVSTPAFDVAVIGRKGPLAYEATFHVLLSIDKRLSWLDET